MKRFLLLLVPIVLAIGAIFVLNLEDEYVGNVVGQVRASTPYRIGSSGPYNYVDYSYEYKTFDGKMHSDVLEQEDRYFLINTFKGQQLKQGRVYKQSKLTLILGIVLIIFTIASLITLLVHWCCFSDSGYYYKMPKNDFGCYNCNSRNFCFFVNTQCNLPIKQIKNFFGY